MPASDQRRRLVVTGRDADGRSLIDSISQVPAIELSLAPGWRFGRVWADGAPPWTDHDGRDHTGRDYYPSGGELRAGIFTIPPDSVLARASDRPEPELVAEADRVLPGGLRFHDPERPGFHTTPTLDLLVVVSGRVRLVLDTTTIDLDTGDVVVQRGTAHAWSNPGATPAEVFFVMLGTVIPPPS